MAEVPIQRAASGTRMPRPYAPVMSAAAVTRSSSWRAKAPSTMARAPSAAMPTRRGTVTCIRSTSR